MVTCCFLMIFGTQWGKLWEIEGATFLWIKSFTFVFISILHLHNGITFLWVTQWLYMGYSWLLVGNQKITSHNLQILFTCQKKFVFMTNCDYMSDYHPHCRLIVSRHPYWYIAMHINRSRKAIVCKWPS